MTQSSDPITGAPILATAHSVVFHGRPTLQPEIRRGAPGPQPRRWSDRVQSHGSKLSFTAFGGTIQDDYNQARGTNSAVPLNFLTGSAATTSPYYLYGILKDISYNYGFRR